MENTIYDLIIIGSGPAGLSAAIYAQRACLNTVVIEKTGISGGQILTTSEVDNYPGLPGIGGFDLGMKMRQHAENLNSQFVTGEVAKIAKIQDIFQITLTDGGILRSRTLIIATGASHQKLGIPGENSLTGMGVSYCATCDGAFFRGKDTAVIGGGDVAVEDAIFLARICRHVHVIHRRDRFRAAKVLSDRLLSLENVTVHWNSIPLSIVGENTVSGLTIEDKETKVQKTLDVNGVFIAIGMAPDTDLVRGLIDLNPAGYIAADETCRTSVPGIFAAGDVRTKQLRQVVSAVSDGANAVYSAQRYLEEGR
ncbi:thioredoxin reductase (NADPH) [Catenibacillus scindens]|uniref:Thioredoxin reductase n=1 Tax=Catenibacillus scindens TaxID=673271 RepID=A0A7W8M520_9FIRM|nr:thioredoxin-disulfide reductase [Catenibacillus scindens]MBB5263891.1 thioredoxin reductase (NADPH) [Catenibacillus scindens]